MLLHLAIMPFAEALAAARKLVADIAAFDTTDWISKLRIVMACMVGIRQGLEIARVIIRVIVVFVVNVMTFWRQLAMLAVIGKPMVLKVNAVDSLSLPLPVSRARFRRESWISKLLPSVVVHRAPTTGESKGSAALDGAGEAGFVALCSFAPLATRRTFNSRITETAKAMIVRVAPASPIAKFFTTLEKARQVTRKVFFHSLNIPLTLLPCLALGK